MCVDSLEVDALTIDVDQLSSLLDMAETIVSGEYHLFLVGIVLLAHHDGIELWVFSRPETEVCETGQLKIES